MGGWCWAERERSSGVSERGHPSWRPRSPNCHCTATTDSSAPEKVQGPPGLAGTLLAADREGTLTPAGRSHPAPSARARSARDQSGDTPGAATAAPG